MVFYIARYEDWLDLLEPNPPLLAPEEKEPHSPGVGQTGVSVSDGGDEEFQKSSGGVLASVQDESRQDREAGPGELPGGLTGELATVGGRGVLRVGHVCIITSFMRQCQSEEMKK